MWVFLKHTLFFTVFLVAMSTAALCQEEGQEEEPEAVYTFLDFDGDQKSDYGLFENQADGSPNELVHQFLLSEDDSKLSEEYGKSTDFVAYGDYDGDGVWEITVVRDNETTLDWYSAGSSTPDTTFGETNDILLTGCDFDNDKITDRAVIRETSLIIQRSSDSEVTTTELELGESMSIKSGLCVDLDGDEALELLFLGSAIQTDSGKSTPLKKCKDLFKGKKKRKKCRRENKAIKQKNAELSSRVDILQVLDSDGKSITSKKAKKATNPVIADINNDGIYEFGFFKSLPRKSMLHYFIANTEGETTTYTKEKIDLPASVKYATYIKRTTIDDSSNEEEQEEGGEEEEENVTEDVSSKEYLLLYDGNELFSLFDLATLEITEQFTNSLSGDSLISGVNIHYTGSNVPEDPEGVCDTIEDFSDGANGRVWKASDHGGTAVFVHPVCDGRSKSVTIIKDGKTLGEMYYTGLANPDSCGLREHWRHNSTPGSFPGRSILAVKMNSGETKCYQLNDTPGRRND